MINGLEQNFSASELFAVEPSMDTSRFWKSLPAIHQTHSRKIIRDLVAGHKVTARAVEASAKAEKKNTADAHLRAMGHHENAASHYAVRAELGARDHAIESLWHWHENQASKHESKAYKLDPSSPWFNNHPM